MNNMGGQPIFSALAALMTIGAGLYILIVYKVVKNIYLNLLQQEREVTIEIERRFHSLQARKSALRETKKQKNQEAARIFTLYDMTKEITTRFDEQYALEVFQAKLKNEIDFEECRLVLPDGDEFEKYKNNSEYLFYPLRGKKKLLGYIVIKTDDHENEEAVAILVHQFALALRRIRLYQDIERLATTDSLTSVFTRRYIMERLQEELTRSKTRRISLAVMMIDIDHFKRFNDQYGHLTGDQILREIAVVIQHNIREIDIVGRFGGEEFCSILPDTESEGAFYVAERIRKAVEQAVIRCYDPTVKATVSIGIASFPKDSLNISELVDKADWALYRAKKQGRNKVCAFGVYDDDVSKGSFRETSPTSS